MTQHLDKKLGERAQNLNAERLLAKLGGGDAVSQELKYHVECLTDLYNRERTYFRMTKKQERYETR